MVDTPIGNRYLVVGAPGGVRPSVAANTAVALAAADLDVLLVDADPFGESVAQYLGALPAADRAPAGSGGGAGAVGGPTDYDDPGAAAVARGRVAATEVARRPPALRTPDLAGGVDLLPGEAVPPLDRDAFGGFLATHDAVVVDAGEHDYDFGGAHDRLLHRTVCPCGSPFAGDATGAATSNAADIALPPGTDPDLLVAAAPPGGPAPTGDETLSGRSPDAVLPPPTHDRAAAAYAAFVRDHLLPHGDASVSMRAAVSDRVPTVGPHDAEESAGDGRGPAPGGSPGAGHDADAGADRDGRGTADESAAGDRSGDRSGGDRGPVERVRDALPF